MTRDRNQRAWIWVAIGIAILLFIFAFYGTDVFAQEAKVQTTRVDLEPVIDTILPWVAAIASTVVAGAISWAAAAFSSWTGIKTEANHREALHSAAMTGINLAIQKVDKAFDGKLSFDVRNRMVATAMEWVVDLCLMLSTSWASTVPRGTPRSRS